MPKFVNVRPNDEELADMYKFYCPACKECHWVSVGPRSAWKIVWSFNGDVDRPTVNPSLLVTRNLPTGEQRCHSFIRDGHIQYLGDCTHAMKNQTVEIPEFPQELINE